MIVDMGISLRGSLICDFCGINTTVVAIGIFKEGRGRAWSACGDSNCQAELKQKKTEALKDEAEIKVVILRELQPRGKEK